MSCPDANVLLEFVSDLLDAQAAHEVERHMDGCPSCRRIVAQQCKLSTKDDVPIGQSDDSTALADTKGSQDPPVSPTGGRFGIGTRIDHFKILRLLGQGGMGEVYLARDTQLGRRVALKVLHGKVAAREEQERIGLEARITARFSHPNIVIVHAIGYHVGSPYLALEYLRGQTLRQRMQERGLPLPEVLRVGRDIARALAEAHKAETVHGDLKPENVMITRRGRVCVLDFGLALVLPSLTPRRHRERPVDEDEFSLVRATPSGEIRGTPAYMAPEQWRAKEVSTSTDIWAWGVVMYELLSGRHPYCGVGAFELSSRVCAEEPAPPMSCDPEVPQTLSALVQRCLHKEPRSRPEAPLISQQLDELLTVHRAPHALSGTPFRGLLPFDEEHSGAFFGRDSEIAAVMERLRREPVLPLVGPSGAGKSSLVQAGVIPRLREAGPLVVLRLRPGPRPFVNLATCLVSVTQAPPPVAASDTVPDQPRAITRRTGAEDARVPFQHQDTETLAESLRHAPRRLNLLLHQLAEDRRTQVMLFVDQLEELYSSVSDPVIRHDFMEAICAASDDPESPVRVLFTLRDEFLVRLADGPVAHEVLSRIQVLRPPGAEALREILSRPVASWGYAFEEPALVEEMVTEVQGALSCLPLLQFAGDRLWDNRDRGRRLLRRSDYQAMHGVGGALAHHADGVLSSLSAAEVSVVRAMFLRLITVEGTRRAPSRTALLEGLAPNASDLLDRMVASRLLTIKQSDVDHLPDVELVHESLYQHWDRLKRWVRESQEELVFLAELHRAAELWVQRGKPPEETWRGRALRDALQSVARCSTPVPECARQFLNTGAELAARRRRRRSVFWAAGMLSLALVAIIAAVVALVVAAGRREAQHQRDRARAETRRAERQHRRAEAEKSTALREGARASLARDVVFEARAKLRRALEIQDGPELRALWWRLRKRALHWQVSMGSLLYAVAYSPQGKTIAVAGLDGAIYLYNAMTRTVRVLRGNKDQIFSLAYSPDGTRLAAGSFGRIVLWDLLPGTKRRLEGHRGIIWGLAFGPRGRTLASGGADKTVRVWDLSQPSRSIVMRGHTRPVRSVSYRRDGRMIASASYDGTVRLWDTDSQSLAATLLGHTGSVYTTHFSPDGRLLASGGRGSLRIWDVQRKVLRRELTRHLGRVSSVRFSPDGGLLAYGRADHSIGLWDLKAGRERGVLRGHTLSVRSLDFGPRGRYLVSGGFDRSVRVWDVRRVGARPLAGGHRGTVIAVDFGPRGERLVTSGWDKTVRMWDVKRATSRLVFGPGEREIRAIRFSPDGRYLGSGGLDATVRLWDLRRSRFHAVLKDHRGFVHDVDFSRDSRRLVSASGDKTVRIWDVRRRTLLRTLKGHSSMVLSATFSPDGLRVASGGHDRTVRVWDPVRGTSLAVQRAHKDNVWGVGFTTGGRRLASSSQDGTVRIWQVDAAGMLRPERVLGPRPGRVYRLAVHPDGQRVGAPGSDGTARIWDLRTGRYLELRGHRSEVTQLRFSADGRSAATASADGSVRLWDTETGRPRWRAPLLREQGPELYTHRGWLMLAPGHARVTKKLTRWRVAVAQRARRAVEFVQGRYLCVATFDDAIEIWDVVHDRRLLRQPLTGFTDLVAVPGGCVSLAGGAARLHLPKGAARLLHPASTAIAAGPSEILVATAGKVVSYHPSGKSRASYPAGNHVTAVARAGEWMVLGFENGGIELVPSRAGLPKPTFSFSEAPVSPVVRLLPGPRGTLVAGFANGLLGMWSLRDGNRLERRQLHGPVVHLLQSHQRLYAATELGQYQVLDLSVFHRSYCALLRQVWRRVPIVWENGQVVVRQPPSDHRCSRR